MSNMVITKFVSWLDGTQVSPTDDLSMGLGYLLFDSNGVPIRRKDAELVAMRLEYLNRGEEFPLDRCALIALNRVVQRPLRFTKTTDQLGRVLAVAFDYPRYPKDPVIPVSLVPLGRQFDVRLKRLIRHIDYFGSSESFINHQRWGRRARRLVRRIDDSLPWGTNTLSQRELIFIRYHLELTIAQPWRTR